uniref:Secreted protein n=1 Tax=Ditylenchus dipsaci TaxID=166011 RepID=A0A915E1W0_9BILA
MHSSIGMPELSVAVFAAFVFINQMCLRSVYAYPMLPWSENEGSFLKHSKWPLDWSNPSHNQKHQHHQELVQLANFPLRHFNTFPMRNFIGEIKRGDLEFEDPRLFSTAFGKRSSSFI